MIAARYYDGRTARGHEVRLRLRSDLLLIDVAEGVPLANWPINEIRRSGSWEGRGPFALLCEAHPDARLLLPDGGSAALFRSMVPQLAAAERVRNRRALRWVGLGTLAAVLAVALVYEAVPRWLAPAIPSSWLEPLGDTLLAGLEEEHALCADSVGRQALERVANRLAATAGYDGKIRVDTLRWRELNAFALPGDRIVLLSGLIDQAEPDEVAGVLAHEVGHVVNSHVNEAVLRALGVQFLLTFLTGTGDLAAAATALAGLGYSRAAEKEADRFAVAAMRAEALRISGLRRFFRRLREEEGRSDIPSWLSTHPATADRILAIPDDPLGVDPFTPGEWQVIRSTC